MGFLTGKKALVIGVASNRSIASGIAKSMHSHGAQIALSYQNDKLRQRVEKCADECNSNIVIHCDASTDEGIIAAKKELSTHWNNIDIIVHSIAFAPRDALDGDYISVTNRENFLTAHDISSYTFTAFARIFQDMLNDNSSLLTVSYLGAIRAIPNYNVMGVAKASLESNVRYMSASLGRGGIRVNAISSGPIKTLAASGIRDFSKLLDYAKDNSALKRNVTTEEVGNVAAFLCSDLASGITGEVVYVDAGYSFYENSPL